MTASSSASWSRFDVVSVSYVPDDGTLGCRETLHVELKDAQGRPTARKSLGPASCLVFATRPGSCPFCSRIRSAGGIVSSPVWLAEEEEKAWKKRKVFNLDLKTATESLPRTAFGCENLCIFDCRTHNYHRVGCFLQYDVT